VKKHAYQQTFIFTDEYYWKKLIWVLILANQAYQNPPAKRFIMKSSVLTSGDTLTVNEKKSKKNKSPLKAIKNNASKGSFRTVKASPSNTKINKNLIQEAVENAIGGK